MYILNIDRVFADQIGYRGSMQRLHCYRAGGILVQITCSYV